MQPTCCERGHMLGDGERKADPGPLMGWRRPAEARQARMGFHYPSPEPAIETEAVHGSPNENTIVIGPTGSGKTRSIVIPDILDHPGPVVVVDVKGEIYRTTSRHLERTGRRVMLVDPFRLFPNHRSSGLDLLQPIREAQESAAAARSITEVLSPCDPGRDLFWTSSANNLVASALHYAASGAGPEAALHTFSDCLDFLHADDVVHTIATMLDMARDLPAEARRGFVSFLQMPDITRGGVLASAQAPLKLLFGTGLRAALSTPDIDLAGLTRGDGTAIFLAWPPTALKSHGAVLRLLLALFLDAIFKRRAPPPVNTLFMIDEAGTIGPIPQVETAFTLARGYGCRVTAVFQSVQQLQTCYGPAAMTVFDNAGTVSVLPCSTARSAHEIAGLLGIDAVEVLSLARDEALVARRGLPLCVVRRTDYLTDAQYRGKWDDYRAQEHYGL